MTETDTLHSAEYDTVHSADLAALSEAQTHASAWLSSPLGDPATGGIDAEQRRSAAYANRVVAGALAGAVGAFAVLGVAIAHYYTDPTPPPAVTVAPGALASLATPAAEVVPPGPALAPAAPAPVTVEVPAVTPVSAGSGPAPVAEPVDVGPAGPFG
jgi:hypothetical protein